MKEKYKLKDGALIAYDADATDVLWTKTFNGCPVIKAIPLSEGGCLVLLDPGSSKEPTFENLLRINAGGDIIWKSPLPQTHDAYTDILETDEGVEARTWQGIRLRLNVSSGSVHKIGYSK